jgi:hypothetical protein
MSATLQYIRTEFMYGSWHYHHLTWKYGDRGKQPTHTSTIRASKLLGRWVACLLCTASIKGVPCISCFWSIVRGSHRPLFRGVGGLHMPLHDGSWKFEADRL